MPTLNLAGPSYALRNRRADVQRCVNWCPTQIESGTGKGGAPAYLKQAPGKFIQSQFGAPVRGMLETGGALYIVAGATLYRMTGPSPVAVGTLLTSSGPVGMSDNKTQVCIVDGQQGYVYDTAAGGLTQISATGWRGSSQVATLDGYGVFAEPTGDQFYISGNQDFTKFNPLEFATVESSPGPIVALCVKHREVLVLKERTGEVWSDVGGADFPFARNEGAALEVGCAAAHSLATIDGAALWLSRDTTGGIGVTALQSYTPQRVSMHALEELLCSLQEEQVTAARAYVYRHEGLSYYVLQVPGLPTTWVYEMRSGIWHERCEWIDGDYAQDYGMCHAYHAGKHYVGGWDGIMYALDHTKSRSGGAGILMRERITPHNALPEAARKRFGSIQIDCGAGGNSTAGGTQWEAGGTILLRYSDDGGMTWGSWRQIPLGQAGQYTVRARATMLGASRDRVWHIRVTDSVRCEPVAAIVDEV